MEEEPGQSHCVYDLPYRFNRTRKKSDHPFSTGKGDPPYLPSLTSTLEPIGVALTFSAVTTKIAANSDPDRASRKVTH